jgi:Ca-activated chloride channel family protein
VSFAWPLALVLLVLVPLYVLYELKKRRATMRFSDLSFFRVSGWTSRIATYVPMVLNALILALMVLALARPQRGRVFEEIEQRGIDIMLCLDISGSMRAEDFHPKNRLHVAKEVAREFIGKRKGDRIGMVVFARNALTQCPLTLNRPILDTLIGMVDVGLLEDGTAVGMGLGMALSRLKDSDSEEKIVILLTDGRNNAGHLDPETAAEMAGTYGIKVYTIGVGSTGPVRYPVDDPTFARRYVQVEIDLDSETLARIAEITGGRFFLATDAEALREVYAEIDEMEPTTFKVKRETVYSEKVQLFLSPALVLLLLCVVLNTTVLRRLP